MSQRPLSPHLQIYRPQWTSVLSITHRGTGVFLCLGLLLLPFWLLAAVAGKDQFTMAQAHVSAWYGKLLLAAFAFSFFYHLCNGIRHLFWDMGVGLDVDIARYSGYLCVGFSLLLTVVALYVGFVV